MSLIKPKEVNFSEDVMDRLWRYVHHQVDGLLQDSEDFRNNKIPEWTRRLKGIPKEKTKSFPFPNASNLVIQLIATRVEQMLARAMTIYMVDPLWTVTAMGDLIGQEGDDQAAMLQQFLSDMALDPEELNLYRKEELMFHDGIAYGTSILGFPWQYLEEEQYVFIPGSSNEGNKSDRASFETLITKDGPSPENIALNRILISNKVSDLSKARFFAVEVPLTREAIEDRIAFGVWSKEDGEKVLASPDVEGTSYAKIISQDPKGIASNGLGNPYTAEYKIYECHFKFLHDKKTFSIIAHYHKNSNTNLRAVFNYFPKNMLPYEDMRFGYDSDSYLGYGFLEMLDAYQQEASQLHNNRLDNETIKNNITFRANKDSELASALKYFPGVVIPADDGEIEVLQTTNGTVDNAGSEQLTISMTNERSGVDPAISGSGSGIVNNKRGIYSSQGTMAILQQQNNRTGLRMMDIRAVHTKIGRKFADLYAHLGIGKRLARYGEEAPKLEAALRAVRNGNLGLIIKASSASSNVEADRQNSILLNGLQEKYMGTVNQIMQALQQPQIDPIQKKFLIDTLIAEQTLTKHIFRSFGQFDVDKLVPFPEGLRNNNGNQNNQPNSRVQGQAQGAVPSTSSFANAAVPTSTPQ